MAEFEHDGSALAAVRAFMAQHDDSSSEHEEPPEKYTPRPARLGVGANPNQAVLGGSTHGLSEANRRLRNALRRQAYAAENEREGNVESSDEEEVESRARAFGKRFKRHHKVEAKQVIENESRSCERSPKTQHESKGAEHADSDGEWGDDILRRMTEEQDVQFRSWAKGFVPVEEAAAYSNGNTNEFNTDGKRNGTQGMLKRKKKKRSRQKNLRRDTRKQHQLPEHLTEETLKAGRVRKSDGGKAHFHASRTSFSSRKTHSLPKNGAVEPMRSG